MRAFRINAKERCIPSGAKARIDFAAFIGTAQAVPCYKAGLCGDSINDRLRETHH